MVRVRHTFLRQFLHPIFVLASLKLLSLNLLSARDIWFILLLLLRCISSSFLLLLLIFTFLSLLCQSLIRSLLLLLFHFGSFCLGQIMIVVLIAVRRSVALVEGIR